MSDDLFNGYKSGTAFWRDNAVSCGIDEAVKICIRYLDMQMKSAVADDEKYFCREIFVAMYEATVDTIIPYKLIYPYDFKTANNRMESSYYHKNREMNQECTRAIDMAIASSEYKTNFYNLGCAAMSIISGYGFERVNIVLACKIQQHVSDGRYSRANKEWARGFIIPDKTCGLCSHAILIDDFTTHVRKLYTEMGAERFALKGKEEHGEFEPKNGYAGIRSIMFNKTQGYVIAHNPDAVDSHVCWQFTVDNHLRDYYWGIYGDEQAAVDGYNARLFVKYN